MITHHSTKNTVNEFQTEMGVVQYFVTRVGSSMITEVDAAIAGLATNGGAWHIRLAGRGLVALGALRRRKKSV